VPREDKVECLLFQPLPNLKNETPYRGKITALINERLSFRGRGICELNNQRLLKLRKSCRTELLQYKSAAQQKLNSSNAAGKPKTQFVLNKSI
jgi:hypothetical protein